ncbi:MAG: HEPN/Toprim-associated domain-containing protein [Pseudomonadota bacterium]
MITLALGRLEVDWGKNEFFSHHGHIFQATDLKDVPSYYAASDDDDDDEVLCEPRKGFGKPLRYIRDRLQLLGHTPRTAKHTYESLHKFHGLEESPLPFDELASALAQIDVNAVSGKYGSDYDPGEFARVEILDRLKKHTEISIDKFSPDHWEIDLLLENFAPYPSLILLAQNPANLDLDVVWQFEDLVESGWAPESDFKAGTNESDKFLIVTEGSSDAKIIEHAIRLLRPHLLDFFRFIDMDEGYPFSGTGNLHRFAQGLVSIGVQNKTLIIYDNDAEGCAKLDATQRLNLPVNMRAIRLPDWSGLADMPTVGPDGPARSDLGGRAASIECYLDLNTKLTPAPLIRWSSYVQENSCYQGALEQKGAHKKAFLDLRSINSNYDFSGMEKVLEAIIRECEFIAEVMMLDL